MSLEPQQIAAEADRCVKCGLCLPACPTGALIAPGVLDATRCLAYWTQTPGIIPAELRVAMGDRVYGCDDCQLVCPWNRFSSPHNESAFEPHPDLLSMDRKDWIELTEEVFKEVFKYSAVKRTKYRGLKRNIRFLVEELRS